MNLQDKVQSTVAIPKIGKETGVVVKAYRKGGNMKRNGELWVRVRLVDGFETSGPASNWTVIA